MNLSIRASKVVSDKPAYSDKEKTESGGTVYRYDEGHIEKRWDLKKKQLKKLNKSVSKLQKHCDKDMSSDDLRTRALGAIVSIIIDTGARVGNEDSVKEANTYGITTLKKKHLNLSGGKAQFKFVGKDNVKQDIFTKNKKVISVLKELIKGKKDNDFIFEIDGNKIWDRAVNRYLSPFDISAKDIRGFKANKLMEEVLKKKDFDEALEEVAKIVGHKPSTLKNQYLDPDLVHKYDKKAFLSLFLSKRAELSEQEIQFIDMLKATNSSSPTIQLITNRPNGLKTNKLIDSVWSQLEPHLVPLGAKMTSAIRTPEDQARVINYYWGKSGANHTHPDIKNPSQRAGILRNYFNISISDPNKTPHSSGRSFDVSGTDLNTISEKIKELSENGTISARLNTMIEPGNNAIHVNIISASQQYFISKSAQEAENMKSIYEDFVNSDASPEIMEEYKNAFGLEQDAKDDEKSYEETKDDPKWNEILIDHGDYKWTRKEIRDHYIKNANKILKEIDDHPVMIYLGVGKNKSILKRNHNDKPIVIKNKEDLEYWADRRLTGIHRVFNSKTKLGFVDLDVHGDVSDAEVQKYAKDVANQIKSKYHTTPIIFDSGGSGYHVEFKLKEEKDIDDLREELHDLCEELNEKYEGFTTGIVKGKGVRTDTTTLKNNGNLRVPYAIHETKGGVKKPLGSDKKAFISKRSEEQAHTAPKLSEVEASNLSKTNPEEFFYQSLNKQYPHLELEALKNIIKDNAKFYFVFKFDERQEPEYKELLKQASELLAQQDVRAFFYYYLNETFPELAKGAVIKLIDTNPGSFFDLGLDKYYPEHIDSANNARNIIDPQKVQVEITEKEASISKRAEENVEKVVEENPAAFFVGKYYKQPEFKKYTRQAAINLLSFKPHLYFTLGLFDEPELSDLLDGAMFALANKNPKFFLNTILPLEQFKDFHHLKEIAENALNKNASLSKRAGELVELSGIPTSIIDDLKTLPGKVDTLNYYTMENGKPVKTPIIDTIRGNIYISEEPKAYIHWVVNSYKLEPYQAQDKQYKVAVNLIIIDEGKQLNEQVYREYGSKLIPLINKLKEVLNNLQNNSDKILREKYPEYYNTNNVVQLFPKKASVQEFPKECRVCGKKYNNYEEFFNQPFRDKIIPTITEDDVGLMCGSDFDEPEIDHVYRDCDCGSTLVVSIPCLHKKHISKEAKKHYKAGIFAIVPKELAKQFPSLGKHDNSKPHITVLFIGKVPKKQEELLENTIKKVLSEQKPFKVKLDEKVSYFPASKQSDNCKIAKLKILSDDLHELNKKLKKAVKDAGIEIEDNYPSYKPHITLEYLPEDKEKYNGNVPSGSFTIEKVELWNGDNKKKFNFKRKLSKKAGNIEVPKKLINEIYQWATPLLKPLASSLSQLNINKYKGDIKFLTEMVRSGGKGSISDFAKLNEIKLNKDLDIKNIINFFYGIDDGKPGKEKEGFFNKLKNNTLLEQSEKTDEDTYNTTINNENKDFRITNNNQSKISGYVNTCWPVLSRVRLSYSSFDIDYSECDTDLSYDLLNFNYDKENNILKINLLDESALRTNLKNFTKYIEDIVSKIDNGHRQNEYEEWDLGEFNFSIKIKQHSIPWNDKIGFGWLIVNNLQFYQNYLYQINALLDRLDNYMNSITDKPSDTYKNDSGNISSSVSKFFKIDPTEIKQYSAFKNEIDQLLKDQFKEIEVNITIADESGGWYMSPKHDKPKIYIQLSFEDFENKNEFITTLSHELVHLIQDIITHAVKLKDNLKDKEWHAGLPGNYDKDKYQMYGGTARDKNDYYKQHALSDVEFYSRLEDSLGKMQRFVRHPGISFSDQQMFKDKQLKNIYELDTNDRIKLFKQRFKEYIESMDDTLKYFRQYDQEKFQKYIKELHKSFEQILNSSIISSRASKLDKYKEKRDFSKTKEPDGKISKRDTKRFVIHNHHATKHHWDLRLEHQGVLESWALPKHKLPSKGEKQLAVQTEPHPLSYAKFEGEIEEGQYGAGVSKIHDSGTYQKIEWKKDTIKFKLDGKKENGSYTLHKTDGKKWILMRMKED